MHSSAACVVMVCVLATSWSFDRSFQCRDRLQATKPPSARHCPRSPDPLEPASGLPVRPPPRKVAGAQGLQRRAADIEAPARAGISPVLMPLDEAGHQRRRIEIGVLAEAVREASLPGGVVPSIPRPKLRDRRRSCPSAAHGPAARNSMVVPTASPAANPTRAPTAPCRRSTRRHRVSRPASSALLAPGLQQALPEHPTGPTASRTRRIGISGPSPMSASRHAAWPSRPRRARPRATARSRPLPKRRERR